ncbi:MAG: AI-2E family transporter [Deltaproteobacteria bacterium]
MLLLSILAGAGYALQHTVSLLLLSFVLAYIFDPVVVYLEGKKVRRFYGILLLYTILGLFSFFCFIYLLPFLTFRWYALLHDIPLYLQKLKQLASSLEARFTPSYAAEEWNWLFERAKSNFDAVLTKLGAGVYAAAGKVVFNLLNVLLSPVLVFFMLFYKQDIKEGLVSWLPEARRDFILAIARDINRGIGGFIRGQIIVSVIVVILSAIALVVLDINHPFFCALFAGVASIIPFIGVFLATIPPLFFAYAEYQSGVVPVKVAVVFALIYFLEGYLVKPLVFKESLDLNPLLTIIMVMAFGELMGFWGVLLAIPIAASLIIIVGHLRRIDQAEETKENAPAGE